MEHLQSEEPFSSDPYFSNTIVDQTDVKSFLFCIDPSEISMPADGKYVVKHAVTTSIEPARNFDLI